MRQIISYCCIILFFGTQSSDDSCAYFKNKALDDIDNNKFKLSVNITSKFSETGMYLLKQKYHVEELYIDGDIVPYFITCYDSTILSHLNKVYSTDFVNKISEISDYMDKNNKGIIQPKIDGIYNIEKYFNKNFKYKSNFNEHNNLTYLIEFKLDTVGKINTFEMYKLSDNMYNAISKKSIYYCEAKRLLSSMKISPALFNCKPIIYKGKIFIHYENIK